MSTLRFNFRTLSYLCLGLLCACTNGGGGAASNDDRSPAWSAGGATSAGGRGEGGGAVPVATALHLYDGGAWDSVTALDSMGKSDEPAVAIDDDANAILLWSEAADAKTDRRLWMVGHTPAGGWTTSKILREHAKTPTVALAGHGYGVWSALQQVWPMSDSPYDSIVSVLFRVGPGVTMTGPLEAGRGLMGRYEKALSAPHAVIAPAGLGVVEYWVTDTIGQTKWTYPFQIGTASGADWQTAAASASRSWAVIDGLGTLSSAWNQDDGHARYTLVTGMGGGQSVRNQDADILFRATPPMYRVTASGRGLLAYSRPASTSTIEVVANRWTPAAVIGIPEQLTVLPPRQSVAGMDVALDRNGNAYTAWLERDGTTTLLKASRAAAGGAWATPVELRRNARIGALRLGTDRNGDVLIVWTELDASGKATALAWSIFRPGDGFMTPAVIASGLGPGADNFVLAVGGDASAVAAWSDNQHIYAVAYRGSPGCPAGQLACRGVCTNPDTDVHQCGICGIECAAPKDHGAASCTLGTCGVRCDGGYSPCVDQCCAIPGGVTALAAGLKFTCALDVTGGIKCWGGNTEGELGNNSMIDSATPVPVSGFGAANPVAKLSAGSLHSCALTRSGGVLCWGYNSAGQLGNNATTNSAVPVAVSGLTAGATAIAAGYQHSCAVAAGGRAVCWGSNASGQLGDGTTKDSLLPVGVKGLDSGVVDIVAGSAHTCALLATGAVKCWGSNAFGQIGRGAHGDSATPLDVSGLGSGVVALFAAGMHSAALLASSALVNWGGSWQTCGSAFAPIPARVANLVAALSPGPDHDCVITTSGAVQCWGLNDHGEFGTGSTSHCCCGPTNATGLSTGASAVAAGGQHSCAVTSRGVLCWGDNASGQLGDGTKTGSLVPVAVKGL